MTRKELFDEIVNRVENSAFSTTADEKTLAENIAVSCGYSLVNMNSIFCFLTGQTLLKYIKERKMMAAYLYLIHQEKLHIEGAYIIAGYGGHQAFDKAFQKAYRMSPSEAFSKKDTSLVAPPLTWEAVSDGVHSLPLEEMLLATNIPERIDTGRIFGLPKQQYEVIAEAISLSEFYSFDLERSNLAYELSEEWKYPLKDTFRYIDDIRSLIELQTEPDEDCPEGFPIMIGIAHFFRQIWPLHFLMKIVLIILPLNVCIQGPE